MKKLIPIFLFSIICSEVKAQCVLNMNVSVDGSGTIVTTNNSIGADPASYIWYVYNLDMNPWVAEYLESANTITYAPMYVGNYLVCLVATESGSNTACDSLCEPLQYTQIMMDLQSSNEIDISVPLEDYHLFPNPAKNELIVHVSGYADTQELQIHNLLGDRVFVDYNWVKNEAFVDLSELKGGIYFVRIPAFNKTLRFVIE